jgi:DNA-binding NtrC family response regulator
MITDRSKAYPCNADTIRAIRAGNPNMIIIVVTEYASIAGAVRAIKIGINEYLSKPFLNNVMIEKITAYFNGKSKPCLPMGEKTEARPTPRNSKANNIIGQSSAILKLKKEINKIKDINATLLITGESGTGKSVIAKEIHYLSNRRHRPFIHVDCASLSAGLIESELFGHEKGSFTGAFQMNPGKFECAKDGTIFLDEISTLPLSLQSKLLNVLQELEFQRLGGVRPVQVKSRIIAATNENLEESIRRNRFRADLFYRLNVLQLHCPALRERKKDIPLLIDYFIAKHAQKIGVVIDGYDDDFKEIMLCYDWPGNVRELENTLKGIIVLSDNSCLTKDDIPSKIYCNLVGLDQKPVESSHKGPALGNISHALKDYETAVIFNMLSKNKGHRTQTAKELGISRRTLQYKLKKLQGLGYQV